jgi:hypothetical protein
MTTIIKNTSGVSWTLTDLVPNILIAAGNQDDLENYFTRIEIAGSEQLVEDIANPSLLLVLNNGTADLSVYDAISHIMLVGGSGGGGGGGGTVEDPSVAGGNLRSSFSPDPTSYSTGEKASILLDSAQSLQIRGPVHTDEGSFRDHFGGSSLSSALTGTPTFTNGSTSVTGSGTLFTQELSVYHYIKRNSDGESAWVRIASIVSDTALELAEPYTGSSGSSTSSSSYWQTMTASGGSITVASHKVSLVNGLGNGAHICIKRSVDYGPLYVVFLASCSTRVTNQTASFGLVDDCVSPEEGAYVEFTPTLGNTQITFVTRISGSLQTTIVTLPNSGVTTNIHRYSITTTGNSCVLHIDNVIVAYHEDSIPNPYTVLLAKADINNAASVGSSTTLAIDSCWVNNSNRVEIANSYIGEPINSQIIGKNPKGIPQTVSVGSTGGLLVESAEFPTFAVLAEDIVLGNNKSLLSMHLSSGSGKIIKLRVIYLRNAQTSAVTGVVAAFDLERFTSHSAGTTLTPQSRDTNDTLPAQVTCRSGATITGASTRSYRWEWSTDEWGPGTLDVEALQVTNQNIFPAFAKKDPALKPFVLRDNQGMHVKCATNTTAGTFDVIFVFTVEDA